MAMPSDVPTEPAVVMLTRNAPTKMAGQRRIPKSSSAASARPVGGQTGEALTWRKARIRPSFPATKYVPINRIGGDQADGECCFARSITDNHTGGGPLVKSPPSILRCKARTVIANHARESAAVRSTA